jgi:hypothetical protein
LVVLLQKSSKGTDGKAAQAIVAGCYNKLTHRGIESK